MKTFLSFFFPIFSALMCFAIFVYVVGFIMSNYKEQRFDNRNVPFEFYRSLNTLTDIDKLILVSSIFILASADFWFYFSLDYESASFGLFFISIAIAPISVLFSCIVFFGLHIIYESGAQASNDNKIWDCVFYIIDITLCVAWITALKCNILLTIWYSFAGQHLE